MKRRAPYIIIVTTAVVVGLGIIAAGVVYAARTVFSPAQTYEAVITTYPAEADLSFNNADPEAHSGTETYEFSDEEVTVIATQDEFSGHQDTYALDAEAPTEITIELTPETEDAEATLREETDYYQQQAEITEESLQDAEQLYEDNDVLQLLPQEDDTFRAYNGISDTEEFGIHVYLYPATEDEGREDFASWLNDEGHSPDDYDVIYHLDEEGPPLEADEPPSTGDLDTADAPDITDHEDATPASDDHDEVVQDFLTITNTHDTAQDSSPSAALMRAEGFLTEDQAAQLFEPENPIVSPRWREAAENSSVSTPWIYAINDTPNGDATTYQARVCWAWIPHDGGTALVDTPRSWTITVTDTEDGPRISDYTYQDAYTGDDPDESICTAHF